jgi:hypothetical protein
MTLRARLLPVLVLFVVAPVVGEVLLGATPISRAGSLLPLSALYGGGAVLVRELARRRGGGWAPLLLLAAAYGILEEAIAVQSLFNPTLFNAALVGGRALGVNWIWTEWTVGYHVVWSITIPIVLVELLFPGRRQGPWLGRPGLAVVGLLYGLGLAFVAVVFRKVVAPGYRAPAPLLGAAALMSVALVGAALCWPKRRPPASARAPRLWLALPVAAAAGAIWFSLLVLPDPLKRGALVLLPMIAAALVAAGVAAWLPRQLWTDRQCLALAAAAMVPPMVFGFFVVTAGNRLDHWGQASACAVVLALLAASSRRLGRHPGVISSGVQVSTSSRRA